MGMVKGEGGTRGKWGTRGAGGSPKTNDQRPMTNSQLLIRGVGQFQSQAFAIGQLSSAEHEPVGANA